MSPSLLLHWPVAGVHAVTQPFGANPTTYNLPALGWHIGHPGIDLRTRCPAFPSGIGTPILAAAPGRVVHAGPHGFLPNGQRGYGSVVILEHADGLRTLYAHLAAISVAPGATVATGQQLGTAGTTGNSTGPHLHFELWVPPFTTPGQWGRVDPWPALSRGLSAPPATPPLRWDKLIWASEEIARRLRAEGYQAEHDWVLANWTTPTRQTRT